MTLVESPPLATCPACGCTDAAGAQAHAIAAALADDDLDRAMTLGLLEPVACGICTGDCSERLQEAREARLRALAARERYRARQARLERRAAERAARRAPPPATGTSAPSLPPAAAAALARAKARAAGKS
ncbi:hypothetical protein ACFONC_03540 [Luteimonas soli]|uniref:Uncharacterized protein n=1 Tax=Luteimonas soli TaxID=1648966 RepID=A0ABV7XJH1_9GAMM